MKQESTLADPCKPGYIDFQQEEGKHQLDDLWLMAGSRCNLQCSHCYVASSPFNNTLQQLTLRDIQPYLDESREHGVKNIYFTGGEPFINLEIMPMIEASLKHAPVTILTNATYPLERHVPRLKEFRNTYANPLTFRVSIDHYEEDKHDAIRGKGMYRRTIRTANALLDAGFSVITTASGVVYENNSLPDQAIIEKFKKLFTKQVDVKLLPHTLEMGTNLKRIRSVTEKVFISEKCMTYQAGNPNNFQCHTGRTVQKINNKLHVYPCPIIYNNPGFELGETLTESFKRVHLTHKACYDFCYRAGGKCTN